MKSVKIALAAALGTLYAAGAAHAQEPVEYVVRVSDPGRRVYEVEARVPATGDTTYVSLPAWTPGHYELENYARYVRRFRAFDIEGGAPLRWDKLDPDTWRVFSRGAAAVRVAFEFWADTVNLSGSLLRDDFGFFNGTNLFVYPEGSYDFPARVRFELPEGWDIATELDDTDRPGVFGAPDYHVLVDNPTFIGRFAIDSVRVDERWIRMAVYPAEDFEGEAREMAMKALADIARTIHGMFGEPPYDRYTVLIYLDTERTGSAGGLEHADSHLDILPEMTFRAPQFTFRAFLYRLLAHEYYHAWNVKRIRPQALWPYRYDRPQYTPLLWVSEGVTDYYAHVVLVRAGLWGEDEFLSAVRGWIAGTEGQPARVAVEDASIDTWIDPTFVSRYVYYDAGAVLGLMLDIKIRHATGNRYSLDDVMARLYREHYGKGRGFATEDFVAHVGEYVGRDEAERFYRDYVDGRRPYPYRETLALAGLTYAADTIVEPFLGVQVVPARDGQGLVRYVVPGSSAAAAGLRAGDLLVRVGVIEVTDRAWADAFVRTYADSIGGPLTVVYQRGGEEIAREVTLGSRTRYRHRVERAEDATEVQLAVWRGILGARRPDVERPGS